LAGRPTHSRLWLRSPTATPRRNESEGGKSSGG